jgi:hypothetical protein
MSMRGPRKCPPVDTADVHTRGHLKMRTQMYIIWDVHAWTFSTSTRGHRFPAGFPVFDTAKTAAYSKHRVKNLRTTSKIQRKTRYIGICSVYWSSILDQPGDDVVFWRTAPKYGWWWRCRQKRIKVPLAYFPNRCRYDHWLYSLSTALIAYCSADSCRGYTLPTFTVRTFQSKRIDLHLTNCLTKIYKMHLTQ